MGSCAIDHGCAEIELDSMRLRRFGSLAQGLHVPSSDFDACLVLDDHLLAHFGEFVKYLKKNLKGSSDICNNKHKMTLSGKVSLLKHHGCLSQVVIQMARYENRKVQIENQNLTSLPSADGRFARDSSTTNAWKPKPIHIFN